MPRIQPRLEQLDKRIPNVRFNLGMFLNPRTSGRPKSVGIAMLIERRYQLMNVKGLSSNAYNVLREQILKLDKPMNYNYLHDKDDKRMSQYQELVDNAFRILHESRLEVDQDEIDAGEP